MVPKGKGTMKLNKIPIELANYWYNIKDNFSYGYYNIFCWLLIAHCIHPGKSRLTTLCRWIPEKIVYKQLIRLMETDRWNVVRILRWHCNQVWQVLPPSEDKVVELIVDKTIVDKTAKKHPYCKKAKSSTLSNWQYGFGVVILAVSWDNYRFPIDFRLVRPKQHPEYKNQNVLFQEMFAEFEAPKWAKMVMVVGDSGFASKKNLRTIMDRNEELAMAGMKYHFTFSLARTWKFENEYNVDGNPKTLKNLVNHLPRCHYKKTWVTDINGRRKYYWVYAKKVRLDTLGDVTIIISKKRRNTPPKKAKIFVTNTPSIKPRTTISFYRRRWYIGVSSKGHILQPVQVRSRARNSTLVA